MSLLIFRQQLLQIKNIELGNVQFISDMLIKKVRGGIQIPRWDLIAQLEPFWPWLRDFLVLSN